MVLQRRQDDCGGRSMARTARGTGGVGGSNVAKKNLLHQSRDLGEGFRVVQNKIKSCDALTFKLQKCKPGIHATCTNTLAE